MSALTRLFKAGPVQETEAFSQTLGLGVMLYGSLLLLDRLTQIHSSIYLHVLLIVLVLVGIRYSERYQRVALGFQLGGLCLLIGGCIGLTTFFLDLNHGMALGIAPIYGWLGDLFLYLSRFDQAFLGINGFTGLAREIYLYAVDPHKLSFHNSAFVYLAITALMGLLLRAMSRARGKFFWLLLPVIGVLVLWFFYVDVWTIFTVFFIGYGLFRFSVKGKSFIFSWTLPVLIPVLAMLLTAITPIEAINKALQPFVNYEANVRTDLSYTLSSGNFTLDTYGYYPLKNKLGGPIHPDRQLKFRVETTKPHLYLRGRVMTTYTGKMWLGKKEELKDLKPFMVTGLKPEKPLKITVRDFQFKTNVVFAPLGVVDKSLASKHLREKSGGIIVTDDFLSKVAPQGYTLSVDERNQGMAAGLSECLQLPPNYSDRVKTITEEVIRGAKSPEEKMAKIQTFLLDHYAYSLSPTVPSEYKDFVEYFLTQETQGYCTYFASATAVMGRVAGVPTRYVEGFLTPKDAPVGRAAPVTGDRAHAWVEAWYGNRWQTIESTPAYIAEMQDQDDAKANVKPQNLGLPKDQGDRSKADPATPKQAVTWEAAKPFLQGLGFVFVPGLFIFAVLLLGRKRYFSYSDFREQAVQLTVLQLELVIRQHRLKGYAVMSPRELLREADRLDPSFGHLTFIEFAEKSLYDNRGISEGHYEEALALHKRWIQNKLSAYGRIWLWFAIAWRGWKRDGDRRKNTAT